MDKIKYRISGHRYCRAKVGRILSVEIEPVLKIDSVFVSFTNNRGDNYSFFVGGKGTYLTYHKKKYKTIADFYKLQTKLEKERIIESLEQLENATKEKIYA